MSLSRTLCVAVNGIDGTVVDVEAYASSGQPAFSVIGLPDSACKQSPDRIRAAASHTGLKLPKQKVTVNLSPAGLTKHGSCYDLAIALAVLATRDVVDPALIAGVVHLGELGLDGEVRPVPGVLPAVLAARAHGVRTVVVPCGNAREAALVSGMEVVPAQSLAQMVDRYHAIRRRRPLPDEPALPDDHRRQERPPADMADVIGQPEARFALEVAAAGGHNLSMVGPPGAGKTMLAERLVGLLPPLDEEVALQATAIHSVLGTLRDGELISRPPFVAPHHGASLAAMVGGGTLKVRPGSISRAHGGVLFLDECPEFKREVLDALRQPLESGVVQVARAVGMFTYPARFQLVLASNPCPCGNALSRSCVCSAPVLRNYRNRLSGPLLDRVDVQLQVHAVKRVHDAPPQEGTAQIAERVRIARQSQRGRWLAVGYSTNASVPGKHLRDRRWRLPTQVTRPIDQQLDRGTLTMRGYDRCLRVAWTLADIAGAERPGADHLLQSLGLRMAGEAA
ncbi:YifB family Mg chelatase-like AAA ATPase [Yimella sp. cx-573]|nr:YifB family Mg chelatase-like AAA ATPase [Yimella sp. cx-573]